MTARRLTADTQQRLWTYLRRGRAITVSDLAKAASASQVYARRYIAFLSEAGYLEGDRGGAWRLTRDTGRLAPRLTKEGVKFVGLWDPNLDPPMPPEELAGIRAALRLTLSSFAVALGWSPKSAIHVRRMERGQKPIAPEIAEKARGLLGRAGG